MIAPGVERSAYFRLLDRIQRGAARELLMTQDLYDNHLVQSATWRELRQP